MAAGPPRPDRDGPIAARRTPAAGPPGLVAADLAARTVLPPLEVPVGALTALVGGPYLLWLLGRRGRTATAR
ncbi:hypothetical protein BIV25_00045 [Streptomyces sp. MUSC 14]|uniref:iron chelate uptake ABC transporter family permease subunit n=1 Tax=Streptomyces sp. MUSC 14 TaxID=1354889 RepID=UPI0008F5BCDD|nr:hypothetical protein BIV25_00045 [Streptomyces sp. MUSC 14]